MRILITGAAGFVGSNLANYLYDKWFVVGVDNLDFGYRDNLNPKIEFLGYGFEELSSGFLDQFDVLVHCACANIIYAQENQVDTFRTNALESIRLFNRFDGKIIYTSTASVYGNATILPTNEDYYPEVSNAYDQSKLLAEMFLQKRGYYTTLRLSNVYGINQRSENPYCGVIGKFIDAGLKKHPMTVYGDGSSTRDYTYIDDVVDALDRALTSNPLNTEINIATGVETSVNDLAWKIGELTDFDYVRTVVNRSIDTITRRRLDAAKAKRLLNWEYKTQLSEGLKKTIEWQRSISQ